MSAPSSQSSSPKRKTQHQQQQTRIGATGVLSSPKFSFRAALVQHKASKFASKGAAAASEAGAAPQAESHQSESVIGSIRSINNASSIPSLKGRGRFNSTSTDSAFTSVLPKHRHGNDSSPETSRASSSLGKRPVDEGYTAMSTAADDSILSDFGPIMRKSPASASSNNAFVNKASASNSIRSRTTASKLPGPPSARSQWNGVAASSIKSLPSPSASKAPRKIARSDSVAEVHATSAQATPNSTAISPASARSDKPSASRFGSVRSRTTSASAKPTVASQQQQRRKIGTLPMLKPKIAPVKTLLDERPIHQLRPALLNGITNNESDDLDSDEDEDDDDDDDDEDADQDGLEGPDVSRIRTRRVASQRTDSTATAEKANSTQTKMLPPAPGIVSANSRIPSFGSNPTARPAGRPHRRSSSNSVAIMTAAHEKENISQIGASSQSNAGYKRHSVGGGFGAPGRIRSSLPLAVSQPVPQTKMCSPSQTLVELEGHTETNKAEILQPTERIPASPTKTSSLSALRSRGLQTDSAREAKLNTGAGTESALPSRPSKQDLGIRASIIHANPVHPSILALQAARGTQHQPISTPEALIKAKKRLSGALLSSSSSSSALSSVGSSTSPSERISSLARSSSINKFGTQMKLQTAPRVESKQLQGAQTAAAATVTSSPSTSTLPRSGSRSPIKSSLLLFPTTKQESADKGQRNDTVSAPTCKFVALPDTPGSALAQRKRVLSSSEIDANLLASLKVVAQKANLKVVDLLDDERQQQPDAVETTSAPAREDKAAVHARSRREVSEELEAWAGDVSVDLMALDLAAGSPVSDVSMLRSPVLRDGVYLDTPPSVLAAATREKSTLTASQLDDNLAEDAIKDDEEEEGAQVDEDGTDISCASPSLRAAAAMRFPRRPTDVAKGSSDQTVETPMRRQGYRNVPSIPSTPFPSAASAYAISPSKSARAYPPSVAMSAKTRSRLKKALRESLGLEAHFASIKLAPHNDDDNAAGSAIRSKEAGAEQKPDQTLAGPTAVKDSGVRKSISAMLLTEDDRYLDELVSAVARIGLEDLAPDQSAHSNETVAHSEPTSPVVTVEAVTPPPEAHPSGSELQTQLSAALSELAVVRSQLQHSQTHTSELEAQLAMQTASVARTQRTQALLETDLGTLKGEMAGVEWGIAKSGWANARVEALAELEDVRVQKDVMLVLGAQMGVWQRMIRARV